MSQRHNTRPRSQSIHHAPYIPDSKNTFKSLNNNIQETPGHLQIQRVKINIRFLSTKVLANPMASHIPVLLPFFSRKP